MSCPECNSSESVVESGSKWCTNCGNQLEKNCEWTFTYALIHHIRRVPVYSRIKRFKAWIMSLKEPLIYGNMERILSLYGNLEFSWRPIQEKRTYFFNKNCVLFFILCRLQIPLKIKTLKDAVRVTEQVEMMNVLLSDLKKTFPFLND